MPPTSPLRWGVLGAAKIALTKVIPAMQRGAGIRVTALASRDLGRAREAAAALDVPRAHGSYEALLADPEVDAVYNPLPNHLHVPWSIRAAEAGKHVLCEKPVGLNAAEVRQLIAARERTGVTIGEAFMVRTHPQWLATKEIVDSGRIGELRLVSGHFSYHKRDPADIRSRPEYGGGALMDIGCYPVTIARWLFGREPTRVLGWMELDPELGVDRLTSALLDFGGGRASLDCATQLVPYQRMQVMGTRGRIEVEIPFNAPPDRPCRILVDDGRDVLGGGIEAIEIPTVDQYTVQGERFAAAVRGEAPVPVPLEDALGNLAAIDALFRSRRSGRWESPDPRA